MQTPRSSFLSLSPVCFDLAPLCVFALGANEVPQLGQSAVLCSDLSGGCSLQLSSPSMSPSMSGLVPSLMGSRFSPCSFLNDTILLSLSAKHYINY